MTLTQRLDQISARLKAATPLEQWKDAGDWFHDCNVGMRIAGSDEREEADCELIANAPADLTFTTAALRELLTCVQWYAEMGVTPGGGQLYLDGKPVENDAVITKHARETLANIQRLAGSDEWVWRYGSSV